MTELASHPLAVDRYEIVGRSWVGRGRLRRDLEDLAGSQLYTRTFYLPPGCLEVDGLPRDILAAVPDLGAGAAIFLGGNDAMVIAPPFPIDQRRVSNGADIVPILDLLGRRVTVGVTLLRLGRYAVGVVQDDELLASKSDSRYVKNRHRKGGSSQRRFERSRERLTRELYDKVCAVMERVFRPYEDRIEYLLMGGERHTLLAFTKRCGYIARSGIEVLPRRLDVDRPSRAALDAMPRQVWTSRVIHLQRAVAS